MKEGGLAAVNGHSRDKAERTPLNLESPWTRHRDQHSALRHTQSGEWLAVLRYQLNDRFLIFGDLDFWHHAATTERDGNTHSDGDTIRFGLGLSFTL